MESHSFNLTMVCAFVLGEIKERTVFVNNVRAGVSLDIVKAVFPCALKVTVPETANPNG
jgi:hypothetical protein